MDITMHQIKNGTIQELMALKNEIAKYLGSKKYSTKSITLLTTMKDINIEISNRQSLKQKPTRPKKEFLEKDDEPVILVVIPDFLQDRSLLKTKRQRTEDNAFILNFNNSFGCTSTSTIHSDIDADMMSAFYIKQTDSDENDSKAYSCDSGIFQIKYSSASTLELKEDEVDLFFC